MSTESNEARVGAWDYNKDGTLRIFSVGPEGAKLLESVEVAADEREDMNAKLVASGARVGATHTDAFGTAGFVWAMDEKAADIWSQTAQVAHFAPSAGFRRVRTFFDVADPGHRGVVAERSDGTDQVVVEEHDAAGKADPTYNTDALSSDIEWAFFMGRDLATWRGVPHYDQLTSSVSNADHVQLRTWALDLAREVDRLPELGDFGQVARTVGRVGKAQELVLQYAPDSQETRRRVLGVRVTSTAGKVSERPLKRGSNKEVAAFLRRVQTPSALLRAMNALLRAQ